MSGRWQRPALIAILLLASAILAGAYGPPVKAHEGGADLDIKKDSTAGNGVREYRIAARLTEGELSDGDEVTIVDHLHVDMSFQGFRDIGAGWNCSLRLIPESEGAFIRCVLVDRGALSPEFKTVVRYDACDLRGPHDSGLVENGATIFLNGDEQATASTMADLPECADLKPMPLPECREQFANDSFAGLLTEVSRALTVGDLEFFRARAIFGFSMKGPGAQMRGLEDFLAHLRHWSETSKPHLTDRHGDGSLRVHAFARNVNVVHMLVTSIVERGGEHARVATVLTWDGRPGAIGPNVPSFPGAWVLINELLFNDVSPLPPFDWLCPGLPPAMPITPPASATPVVISPPSTGDGGGPADGSGGSPLILLGTVSLVAGFALLAGSRKVSTQR
jgi:hypothetical protein